MRGEMRRRKWYSGSSCNNCNCYHLMELQAGNPVRARCYYDSASNASTDNRRYSATIGFRRSSRRSSRTSNTTCSSNVRCSNERTRDRRVLRNGLRAVGSSTYTRSSLATGLSTQCPNIKRIIAWAIYVRRAGSSTRRRKTGQGDFRPIRTASMRNDTYRRYSRRCTVRRATPLF